MIGIGLISAKHGCPTAASHIERRRTILGLCGPAPVQLFYRLRRTLAHATNPAAVGKTHERLHFDSRLALRMLYQGCAYIEMNHKGQHSQDKGTACLNSGRGRVPEAGSAANPQGEIV
jgi:hypothetical protein